MQFDAKSVKALVDDRHDVTAVPYMFNEWLLSSHGKYHGQSTDSKQSASTSNPLIGSLGAARGQPTRTAHRRHSARTAHRQTPNPTGLARTVLYSYIGVRYRRILYSLNKQCKVNMHARARFLSMDFYSYYCARGSRYI